MLEQHANQHETICNFKSSLPRNNPKWQKRAVSFMEQIKKMLLLISSEWKHFCSPQHRSLSISLFVIFNENFLTPQINHWRQTFFHMPIIMPHDEDSFMSHFWAARKSDWNMRRLSRIIGSTCRESSKEIFEMVPFVKFLSLKKIDFLRWTALRKKIPLEGVSNKILRLQTMGGLPFVSWIFKLKKRR